jgi:hypothetical protein
VDSLYTLAWTVWADDASNRISFKIKLFENLQVRGCWLQGGETVNRLCEGMTNGRLMTDRVITMFSKAAPKQLLHNFSIQRSGSFIW